MRIDVRKAGLMAATLLALAMLPPSARGDKGSADTLNRECELGVMLANQGKFAEAESVFISLLSHSPDDARALVNLGNLSLLTGKRESARVFYETAARRDSLDPGIQLDQAVWLYLQGRDDAASLAASQAVYRAGGTTRAASLIGGYEEDRPHEDGSEGPGGVGHAVPLADLSAWIQFPLARPKDGQRTVVHRKELAATLFPDPHRNSAPARPAPETLSAATQTTASTRRAAEALYWKR